MVKTKNKSQYKTLLEIFFPEDCPKLMTKKRKNLDLTPEAVKTLTVEAAKKDTVFKLYAEQVLEDKAKELQNKK